MRNNVTYRRASARALPHTHMNVMINTDLLRDICHATRPHTHAKWIQCAKIRKIFTLLTTASLSVLRAVWFLLFLTVSRWIMKLKPQETSKYAVWMLDAHSRTHRYVRSRVDCVSTRVPATMFWLTECMTSYGANEFQFFFSYISCAHMRVSSHRRNWQKGG